jgi:hypothetical protein
VQGGIFRSEGIYSGIGENTFVNTVMNIPDKGKKRKFSFGLADSLSVFKEYSIYQK